MRESERTKFTENDIRPKELMNKKSTLVDADRQFLLSQKGNWIKVACPACGLQRSRLLFEKKGFSYKICPRCGSVYISPRPSLSLMRTFYSNSRNYAYWNDYIFSATEDVRRNCIFRPRAEKIAKYSQKYGCTGGIFLEVGAAFGTFCEEIRKIKEFSEIIAIEPNLKLAQTCRSKGFKVLEKFIEDVEDSEIADVVVALEVLEHLFSPKDLIINCGRILRKGGLLVLSCPNIRGFDISLLGEDSEQFSHEHVNYFHPQSIALLLEVSGLEVLEIETPGQLDCDIVRQAAIGGRITLESEPFLKKILIDEWEEFGELFQDFLSKHKLSSHMWAIVRKG